MMMLSRGIAAASLVALGCGGSGSSGSSGGGGASSGDGDMLASDGGTSSGDGDEGNAMGGSLPGDGDGDAAPADFRLPRENGSFDYQIGGAYDPPEGVAVVSRDREDPVAAGIYNICYINGFQSQPQDEEWWLSEHPDLVLRDGDGDPVIDEDWGEMILDTSSPEKRASLAVIVGGWIEGCAAAGYDATEVDNLDTYSRSNGLLNQDDNVAFMALLSEIVHENGMASGQKNSAEILARVPEMKTDFAVAEECNRWDECGDYTAVYGNLVYVIEYRDQDFEKGCSEFPDISIVRRDLDVTPVGSNGYIFEGC